MLNSLSRRLGACWFRATRLAGAPCGLRCSAAGALLAPRRPSLASQSQPGRNAIICRDYRGSKPSPSRVPLIGELRSVQDVLDVHERYASKMQPMDVSACWNTISKLVRRRGGGERAWLRDELRRRPDTLRPLLDSTLAVLLRAKAQPIANIGHGIAVMIDELGFDAGPEVWHALAKVAVPRLGEFREQGLSNTAWAFAKADIHAPALFAAVAEEALPRLGDFTEQGLTNTVWAYAKAGEPAPALFAAVAEEAVPRLGEFREQGLKDLAWAYATADIRAPALFAAVAEEAVPRLGEFTEQHLSNTATLTVVGPSPVL